MSSQSYSVNVGSLNADGVIYALVSLLMLGSLVSESGDDGGSDTWSEVVDVDDVQRPTPTPKSFALGGAMQVGYI